MDLVFIRHLNMDLLIVLDLIDISVINRFRVIYWGINNKPF